MSDVFTEEFSHLHPQLTTIARKWVDTHEDAEDLAAQTIARCFEKIHLYTPGTDALGWACRIMRNLTIDASRRKSVTMVDASGEDYGYENPSDISFEDDLVDALSIDPALLDAIASLPVSFQRTLELKAAGWTRSEIATELNIAPMTVSTRMLRIRQRIAEHIGAKSDVS